MRKKVKNTTFQFFADAFHEVVVPILERIQRELTDVKNDIGEIKDTMATKTDIDRIERKLIKKDDRLDRHGVMLENHEKRIKTLESRARAVT